MEMIFGGRNAGKTSACVKWTKEHAGAIMVVPTEQERRRVMADFALEQHQVYAAADVVSRVLQGRGRVTLALDNAELILRALLGDKIGLMTFDDPKTCIGLGWLENGVDWIGVLEADASADEV